MLWLKDYVVKHVQPIVDNPGEGGLHTEFKASLNKQKEAFQNL